MFDACFLCPLDTILLVIQGTPENEVGVFGSTSKGDAVICRTNTMNPAKKVRTR